MKEIGIGAGLLGIGCGIWLAVSGGINLGEATAKRGFDYETASLEDRTKWLQVQAEPMRKMLSRSLPNGRGPAAVNMRVKDVRVDARRRAITAIIRISGMYQLDKRAVPAAKKSLTETICPSYAASELGKNKVQILHSFVGKKGREELSLVISPIVCRKYM